MLDSYLQPRLTIVSVRRVNLEVANGNESAECKLCVPATEEHRMGRPIKIPGTEHRARAWKLAWKASNCPVQSEID